MLNTNPANADIYDPDLVSLDQPVTENRAAAIMQGKSIPCMLHYLSNPFPKTYRPVYIINPGARIAYGAEETAYRVWASKIDALIYTRCIQNDRNGIIHTGSYPRIQEILKYSRYTDRIITHDGSGGDGQITIRRKPSEQGLHTSTVEAAVEMYRDLAGLGFTIASPRLTTGFSFPDDTCRFNLLAKAPFPSMDDLITMVRAVIYPDYISDQVAQIATQAMGRGNRHMKDWCENFILDLAMVPYMHEKRWLLPPDMPIQYWSGVDLPPLLRVQ